MKCAYSGYTDKGGRKNNEDAFLCTESERGYLFLVADGLGGHGKGEIASALVVQELQRQFAEKEQFDIEAAIRDANRLLLQKQEELGVKMKTTVTAAVVTPKGTTLAHVGDSRIYAFRKKEIVFQTEDHSAAWLALTIEKSITDVRQCEERNVLTRALGVSEDITISVTELENGEYDRLLLCSDGFWEYVLEPEMADAVRSFQSPEKWLEAMRKLLQQRIPGENDNNTAVAVIKRRG